MRLVIFANEPVGKTTEVRALLAAKMPPIFVKLLPNDPAGKLIEVREMQPAKADASDVTFASAPEGKVIDVNAVQ